MRMRKAPPRLCPRGMNLVHGCECPVASLTRKSVGGGQWASANQSTASLSSPFPTVASSLVPGPPPLVWAGSEPSPHARSGLALQLGGAHARCPAPASPSQKPTQGSRPPVFSLGLEWPGFAKNHTEKEAPNLIEPSSCSPSPPSPPFAPHLPALRERCESYQQWSLGK